MKSLFVKKTDSNEMIQHGKSSIDVKRAKPSQVDKSLQLAVARESRRQQRKASRGKQVQNKSNKAKTPAREMGDMNHRSREEAKDALMPSHQAKEAKVAVKNSIRDDAACDGLVVPSPPEEYPEEEEQRGCNDVAIFKPCVDPCVKPCLGSEGANSVTE